MAWLGREDSHYCKDGRHDVCDARIYVSNVAGNVSRKGCCECSCHLQAS